MRKSHPLELVYVALSRVTIVTRGNSASFFSGRRNSTSVQHLQDESKGLGLNPLQTVSKTLTDFISNRRGLSIISLNCQRLRAHTPDVYDTVLKRPVLKETQMVNEQPAVIPNFNCIVNYKGPQVLAAGVAIYHNVHDTTAHSVSSYMDIRVKNIPARGINVSEIGKICMAHCTSEYGQTVLMVVVYISPQKTINDIIHLLQTNLLIYTAEGSRILRDRTKKI